MITRAELVDAREELLNSKSTIQNCEKLAAVCTVLDHCYPDSEPFEVGYSGDTGSALGYYGDTQFLSAIAGRYPEEIFPLLDELITTIQVLNPRLYASFMRRLTE